MTFPFSFAATSNAIDSFNQRTDDETRTTSNASTNESGQLTQQISVSDDGQLQLRLNLEQCKDMQDAPRAKKTKCEKAGNALKFGAIAGALATCTYGKYALACQFGAMAITEFTQDGSLTSALKHKVQPLVTQALNEVQSQFYRAKDYAENLMLDGLHENPFLDESATKMMNSTNKFMGKIVGQYDVHRNQTLTYLADEEEAFSQIQEDLATGKGEITKIRDAINDVEQAFERVKNFANDNYSATHADFIAARDSYNAAVARLTGLVSDVSSRMNRTCDNIIDQWGKGRVRREILDGAKNMCVDVREFLSSAGEADDSPNLSGSDMTPEDFEAWVSNEEQTISGQLSNLRESATVMEDAFDNSISVLATRETARQNLQTHLQNVTESPAFGSVAETIEEVKSEYRISAGGNRTEHQQIIQDAVITVEQQMNKTMVEEIVPLLENMTEEEIKETINEYEKYGRIPKNIFIAGRYFFIGMIGLCILNQVLEELEVTDKLGKIPGVKVRYKPKHDAGYNVAKVPASEITGTNQKSLYRNLLSDIGSTLCKHLMRADVLSNLTLLLLVSTIPKANELGNGIGDRFANHTSSFNDTMYGLNQNITEIVTSAIDAKNSVSVDFDALHQDTQTRLREKAKTDPVLAQELAFYDALGITDCYIDAATGSVYSQDQTMETAYLDQFPEDSIIRLKLEDIYSEESLEAILTDVVNEHIDDAAGDQKDERTAQRIWTGVMLGVSAIASIGVVLGKYNDIYKLSDHGLSPKDIFTWTSERKAIRDVVARLPLLFDQKNVRPTGDGAGETERFLETRPDQDYMKGYKAPKKQGADDETPDPEQGLELTTSSFREQEETQTEEKTSRWSRRGKKAKQSADKVRTSTKQTNKSNQKESDKGKAPHRDTPRGHFSTKSSKIEMETTDDGLVDIELGEEEGVEQRYAEIKVGGSNGLGTWFGY